MKHAHRQMIYFTCVLLFSILCICACRSLNKSQSNDSNASAQTSLTFLTGFAQDFLEVCDGDPNHSIFYQELEKRTHVHIDWVSSSDELETKYRFGQSGSQTADLLNTSSLPASLDESIDNGTILDLTELLPKYAPNYYKIIQDPDIKNFAYTNTGRIGAIYSIKQEKQKPWAGLQIRKDWLDELQLAMPETYKELEQVLIAFKEKKGATIPLMLPPSGYTFSNDLNAGFQVASDFFHIGDQVSYGPSTEEWKEYLTLMNRWYQMGLISSGFSTDISMYADAAMVSSGTSGVWFGLYTFPADCNFSSKTAEIVALPAPKLRKNDTLHIRMADSYSDNSFCISAECEHPELALAWVDYLFSEEGALLANYGIEGLTYQLDENKVPVFTDLMTHNPQGLTFTQALKKYTFPPGAASAYVDWERETKLFPARDVAMCDVWSSPDTDYLLPSNLPFTSEEMLRLSELTPSISACMRNYTLQFIMGILPLSEFDTYVDELNSCGLQEALTIYQNAFDRCQ